jgi:hypothetical protein
MFGWYGARLLIVCIGLLLFLSGLLAVASGPAMASSGIWAVVVGLVLVIAAFIERSRYRSAEAEQSGAGYGPGGGEPVSEPLDPRFRPTDERFEDPTTRQRMRVWTDPTSGERRYVAED